MVSWGSGGAAIGKIIFTLMCIEILANMTQVSDVAPGPLVLILTSECHALVEGAITIYVKRLRFDTAIANRA